MFSNSSGPPAGYANNYPSFQNCTVCHSGNVNSGNGSIEFSGLPIYYTPGQVYQIEIVVEGTNSRGYGFQATSQVDNIAVGSFVLNNNSNYGFGISYMPLASFNYKYKEEVRFDADPDIGSNDPLLGFHTYENKGELNILSVGLGYSKKI